MCGLGAAACSFVVLVLAGCLGNPGPAAGGNDAAAAVGHADALGAAFRLSSTGCLEGGGHSVHPKIAGYLPEPWLPADVLDDTGTPPLNSEFYAHPTEARPEPGNTMGNWHVATVCAASDLDGRALTGHVFGYVGMRVEPPPFDAGPPADRHYLVTVVATNDADLRERLHHLGVHATDVVGDAAVTPQGLFHNLLDTTDHGVYESYFRPQDGGAMPGRFRLWFQADNGDGTFSPVALEVENTGGTRWQAQGFYGTFSHLETQDHAPLPGAGGECPGVAYSGFDRVLTPGARPNVTLDEAYIHL